MARDSRASVDDFIEQVLVEESTSRRSLARWIAEQDERLEEDDHALLALLDKAKILRRLKGIDESIFMFDGIIGPMGDFLITHARRVRPRPNRSASRYSDEIEALRSNAAAGFVSRSGQAERLRIRLHLGGDVQGGVRAPEPHIDPWAYAVGSVLHQIEDSQLLFMMYVELRPPTEKLNKKGDVVGYEVARSAVSIAHNVKEKTGNLPLGSQLAADPETISAALLIAEELGALKGFSESEHLAIARTLGKRASRARKELRKQLQAIKLDVPPHRAIPSHETIAAEEAPSGDDLDMVAQRKDARIGVACCTGIVIVAGVRQPCRDLAVVGPESRHPTASWPTCEICDKPILPQRTR